MAAERYAIDTEFHRERTYFPKVALVQIAWADGLILVDPLQVDMRALGPLMAGEAVAVLHAGDQDLEVFDRSCGGVPGQIFDTQIAAGFVGMSTPSLASLHDHLLGLRLPKGDRLTDWLARPLSESQLDYAASDVAHLLEIHDLLLADLGELGRLDWVADECVILLDRDRGARDPNEAWRRIKEVRQLRGRKLAIAQAVAAWREERAVELDQPPRFVLPDLGVVAVAQRAPESTGDLGNLRGVDGRFLKGKAGRALLKAVERGRSADVPERSRQNGRELDRELRPAVTLVSAWLSQLAREKKLDTAMLGTRSDIEALLRKEPEARLANGWRAEVAGDAVSRLVEGRAALAFDGAGGLVLEPRAPKTRTD